MKRTGPISRRKFLAASAAGVLMPAFGGRFTRGNNPQMPEGQWQRARELIRSGRIGKVQRGQVNLARSRLNTANPIEPHFEALAPLLFAVGAGFPIRVSAMGNLAPDGLIMTADYPGGYTIVLASSLAQATIPPPIIRGDSASLELRGDGIAVTEYASLERGPSQTGETTLIETAKGSGPDDECIDGIRSWEKRAYNAKLGYVTMAVLEAAVQACCLGKTIYFDTEKGTIIERPPRFTTAHPRADGRHPAERRASTAVGISEGA